MYYLDVGTSGGVCGLERGYCLMIGGATKAVRHLNPIFKALAPGAGSVSRTPGRRFTSRGEADCADRLLSAMRYQFGGHREHQAFNVAQARPA